MQETKKMTEESTIFHVDPEQQQTGSEQDRFMAFVESLERHGEDGQAVAKIATELGYSEDDIIAYAKRYLLALIDFDDEELTGSKVGSHIEQEWSAEEATLFEALLVLHIPNDVPSIAASGWAEKVAANLPGRSTSEVIDRYNQMYATKSFH